ncbi:hypothetical protein QP958_11095, partial [Corynebacterium marquesiae]|uniref:hypothetical protein n=1 Tax=Corynebacterium marquesiae TaxID=2913503 RepID=UPI00254B347E
VQVPGHDHCAGSCDGDVEGSDAPSMEEGAGDVDGLVGVPVEVVEDGAEGYWEGGFFALDSFGGPCCAGGVVDVGVARKSWTRSGATWWLGSYFFSADN